MSEDKCRQITTVTSCLRKFRTVLSNGKNQLHVVQTNIVVIAWNLIGGPVVEVILNGELLWQSD